MPLPSSMDATWLNGAVSFNAQELRRADAAMFGGDGSALGVRGGIVRHGDTSLDVSVNVSDVVTIQPGAVVIPGNSGTGNGCYRAALGAVETGNLAARNATNPRIDLLVFRVLDTDVVAGHGAYTGRIELIAGTPAASPVAPALPVMAVELARITVPATGGGAATVDKSNRTYDRSPENRLPVPTASKLPASAPKWQQAIALDTGLEYTWDGTAWVPDFSTWTAATYQNGWQTEASTPADFARYMRDGTSRLWLRGYVVPTVTWTSIMFTLPVGLRPASVTRLPALQTGSDTTTLLRIGTDGAVNAPFATSTRGGVGVTGIVLDGCINLR